MGIFFKHFYHMKVKMYKTKLLLFQTCHNFLKEDKLFTYIYQGERHTMESYHLKLAMERYHLKQVSQIYGLKGQRTLLSGS